jgi:predicted RecB family nuclease
LRDAGIRRRDQVAELDLPTARLVHDGVDAERWREDAAAVSAETPIGDIRPRATAQVAKLEAAGVDSAQAVLAALDPLTARFGPFAADAIVNARAAIGPEPVYRLADGVTEVTRGDIELDIDMENTNDGVYQWGVLVTDRAGSGLVEEGYRPFVTWAPMTVEEELRVFLEFWVWLTRLRTEVTESGLTLRAYCWFENAENTQMRRISEPDADLAKAVEEFIESEDWVDMYEVFRAGWTTGEPAGLKHIAPLAGHSWDVEDAGGGMSMVHHAAAVGGDEAARRWLLDYNRGDVEATRAIREWLEGEAARAPVMMGVQ